jgi:hypothetical protein
MGVEAPARPLAAVPHHLPSRRRERVGGALLGSAVR